ncbi:ATP-binding protein [Nakamurella leprariae]|uniref:DNA binding domain-containing protein n=1 Tax=Nakamurella leprariae TaxID=2803911 RepID=A0A938YBL9_9ACTN|nr:ATP-binding protein [Nakamurella leprariae]MBM9466611.1 putative DNA binding domain-containing protein [Nakamurella leprariae]
MEQAEAAALVEYLRAFGSEDASIEAKTASTTLPTSVLETLSAFANSPGGGTLVLGVDQGAGFAVTGVGDVAKLQHDLASQARDSLSPPLRPAIHMHTVDGANIIVADVSELPRSQKPCYITSKGIQKGSYVRVADGDRHLTTEEVNQVIAERGQPLFDHELVDTATIEDLDPNAVSGLLSRVRERNPRVFGREDSSTILRMLNVLKADAGGELRPTIGGLLSLGRYPQQFFPQLCLTFVHYPTTSGEPTGATRFLDNVRIDGSIPAIAAEALAVVQRNMSRRAMVDASGRQDVWEYPPEALREALVNALVHRDLSPGTRGTQVQVEMFPDQLRILNPGGLFGAVDIGRLGDEGVSSSRNGLLLRLLEDTYAPGTTRTVCENRGSGIRTMRAEFSRAGMRPPEFTDRVTSFRVVMPNHTLFDDETVKWLGSIGIDGLKDTQRTALAILRTGQVMDNARYRVATGLLDSRAATAELQDLVARELVEQTGTRGGARYSLSDYARTIDAGEGRRVRPNRRKQILELIALRTELSKTEVSSLLNLNPKTAEHWLGRLKREGAIVAVGTGPRNTRYQLAPPPAQHQPQQQDGLFEDPSSG